MKINLFKKENDDNIYYTIEGIEGEKVLNFENIKDIAKTVLMSKVLEDNNHEVVVSENSLDLYKATLESVIKSVNDDDELYELFTTQPKDVCDASENEITVTNEEKEND